VPIVAVRTAEGSHPRFGHQRIVAAVKARMAKLGPVRSGEPERTDEEIAAEEVGGDLVLEISKTAWRQVVRNLGLDTRLLEAYECGGTLAVVALVSEFGLVADPDPPGPVPRVIN
jgi:hypothetical protein